MEHRQVKHTKRVSPIRRMPLIVTIIFFFSVTFTTQASEALTPSSNKNLSYVRCKVLDDYCKIAKLRFDEAPNLDGLDVLEQGYCLGYFDGISVLTGGVGSEQGICIPTGARGDVILNKLVPAFLAWTENHPDSLNAPEDQCVISALRDGFPCPNK